MAWWHRFLAPRADAPLENVEYKIAFTLYNADASRGAEVRERNDGRAYFVDLEHVEGTTFQTCGEEVGPYESPEAAEAAAIRRPWFSGDQVSN